MPTTKHRGFLGKLWNLFFLGDFLPLHIKEFHPTEEEKAVNFDPKETHEGRTRKAALRLIYKELKRIDSLLAEKKSSTRLTRRTANSYCYIISNTGRPLLEVGIKASPGLIRGFLYQRVPFWFPFYSFLCTESNETIRQGIIRAMNKFPREEILYIVIKEANKKEYTLLVMPRDIPMEELI